MAASCHDLHIEIDSEGLLRTAHKGNNKITELRTILQRESQNSYEKETISIFLL